MSIQALHDVLFRSPWPGMAFWSILYISDYAMTITCARLYKAGVNEKIIFEGSYELTPLFQSDIDRLRLVSPRFVAILILNLCLLGIVWFLDPLPQSPLYEFALGSLIGAQLAIHVRHLRNLFLFRAITRSNAIRGRIEYSRPLMLRMSSFECLSFSGLFLVLFVFTQRWFILGGALACFSIAMKHRRLARKLPAGPTTVVQSPQKA